MKTSGGRIVCALIVSLMSGRAIAATPLEVRRLAGEGRTLEALEQLGAALDELEARTPGRAPGDLESWRKVAHALGATREEARISGIARDAIDAGCTRVLSGPLAERIAAYRQLEETARTLGVAMPAARARAAMLHGAEQVAAALPLHAEEAADARARELLAVLDFARAAAKPAELARWRGLCHLQLGQLGDAARELQAALDAGDAGPETRLALARALWRDGHRDRPLDLAQEVLARGDSRPAAELLVAFLRHQKRNGQAPQALETATAWARRLSEDAAEPLWILIAECRVEAGQLAEAMNAAEHVPAGDQNWLLGGMVRLARTDAAKGPVDRAATHEMFDQYLAYHPESPGTVRVLDGDLAVDERQSQSGARAYAASLSAGDVEAETLVRRLQERSRAAGAPVQDGQLARLLGADPAAVGADTSDISLFAGRNPTYAAAMMKCLVGEVQQARENPDRLDHAVWTVLGAAGEPENARVQQHAALNPMEAQWVEATFNAPVAFTSADVERLAGIGHQLEESMPAPRRELLRRYVANDLPGALAHVDALAMTAWKLDHAGTGITARALGGMVIAPHATSALAGLVRAQASLQRIQDKAEEPKKLARVMEVAGVKTDWPVLRVDPIVIDLDGNGVADLTPPDSDAGAVRFDLMGLGSAQRIQWLKPGHDGWLCQDTDGDGRITSGLEMFGSAGGYADGFEKLAKLDTNGDGVISGAELAGLSVWRDENGNGATDPGELVPVAELGITSISVPKVGLRSVCVIRGVPHMCCEVWPTITGSRPELNP